MLCIGDVVANPNGDDVEVVAILPDSAGSWVDVGEKLYFCVDTIRGVEVGPYTLDQLEEVS